MLGYNSKAAIDRFRAVGNCRPSFDFGLGIAFGRRRAAIVIDTGFSDAFPSRSRAPRHHSYQHDGLCMHVGLGQPPLLTIAYRHTCCTTIFTRN